MVDAFTVIEDCLEYSEEDRELVQLLHTLVLSTSESYRVDLYYLGLYV